MHVKLDSIFDTLSPLIPYDMLVSAFSEAEELLSNDVAFWIATKCPPEERCIITKLRFLFRYDYVNSVVMKAFLEVYLSPEITVGEFFGNLNQVISKFGGEFELSIGEVKIVFGLSATRLSDVFKIINSLKDSLKLEFQLSVEGYEVLVRDEG
ncbi:MAG: hypothetical protein QXZ10_04525 [Sulfolobales archaeon]